MQTVFFFQIFFLFEAAFIFWLNLILPNLDPATSNSNQD